jgi:hypothetical protein
MYLDGYSLRGLCKDFRMTQNTLRRVIKALNLPDRTGKNPQITVSALHNSEFKESDVNSDVNSDDNHDVNLDDNLNFGDCLDEPVQHKSKKFFSVPTLRELEKRNQAIEIIRAETEYKNKWRKDNG